METVMRLTNSIKARVKKLFKLAYNLNKIAVTVADIKKVFPQFDGRKVIHWFNLIDKLEAVLHPSDIANDMKEAVNIGQVAVNETAHFYVKLEAAKRGLILDSRIDWLSFSVNLYNAKTQKYVCTINCNRQGVWSIAYTTRMPSKVIKGGLIGCLNTLVSADSVAA